MELFLEQNSTLDYSITERKIGDCHERTYKDPDEPEPDSDNVKLNIDKNPTESNQSLMMAIL